MWKWILEWCIECIQEKKYLFGIMVTGSKCGFKERPDETENQTHGYRTGGCGRIAPGVYMQPIDKMMGPEFTFVI